MSLYELAKDAAKIEQRVDNIELIQKLIDVQQAALDMQEKQQILNSKIHELESKNKELLEYKKYDFAPGHSYWVDSSYPERHFCPVCTAKLMSPAPLSSNNYCGPCKRYYL